MDNQKENEQLKQEIFNLKEKNGWLERGSDKMQIALEATESSLEIEKKTRVQYQDILYKLCALADSFLDLKKDGRTTIHDVAPRLELLIKGFKDSRDEALKREEELKYLNFHK